MRRGSDQKAATDGVSVCRSRHTVRRSIRSFDVFPAAYHGRCDRCSLKIKPGVLLRFHAAYDKAIHAACEEVQRRAVQAARRTRDLLDAAQDLPTGLKPGTQASYAKEWSQYVSFAERMWSAESVPGRDEDWNPYLLWRYMLHRAERCKPTTVFSAVSALAQFGTRHGFVLPTQRFDGNPLFYRQICNMKKEISLIYRSKHGTAGATFDVQRSTPLGAQSISLILSHLQVYDEQSFRRLSREDRHQTLASMMQHNCGMRFGHFLQRKYRIPAFVKNRYGTFRLLTDWHRYSGQRSYCLEFAQDPRWPCLRYAVFDADGVHVAWLTTAQVMQWHFDELEEAGESLVFAPTFGVEASRAQRKAWLQKTLLAALHVHEVKERELVKLVSPHAFRAGLAGDLLRADVAPQTIAIWCRWWSMRAMRLYADRPELCASRTAVGCRLRRY